MTLDAFVASLVKISGGDIETLSRTTEALAEDLTRTAPPPAEPSSAPSAASHENHDRGQGDSLPRG
jgi:hypothetical protein